MKILTDIAEYRPGLKLHSRYLSHGLVPSLLHNQFSLYGCVSWLLFRDLEIVGIFD
jgi:hypothetical protein